MVTVILRVEVLVVLPEVAQVVALAVAMETETVMAAAFLHHVQAVTQVSIQTVFHHLARAATQARIQTAYRQHVQADTLVCTQTVFLRSSLRV